MMPPVQNQPPPPPVMPAPPRAQQRRGFMVGLIVGVVIAGLAVPIIYLSGSRQRALSSSPGPERQPEVTGRFIDQDWAEGERLWLSDAEVTIGKGCELHTFTLDGKTLGSYQSDCASWKRDGHDIILFYVWLRNPTDAPVSFDLKNFVLITRDSRRFRSLDLVPVAHSRDFLPSTGTLPPHSNIGGVLPFDGEADGLLPTRLSYFDAQQTLTVIFEGEPGVQFSGAV